jgi:uncharacterized MAPEG superfamily protein
MVISITVLLGFTTLTFALAAVFVLYRVGLVLSRQAPANAWPRGNPQRETPAWVLRFEHAHANCLENLPLYAALVLAASLLEQLPVIDGLAYVFFGFRLAQTATHLISTNALFVFIRGNMLLGQWACLAYWILKLSGML